MADSGKEDSLSSKLARTLSISKKKTKSRIERHPSKDFIERAQKLESQLKFRNDGTSPPQSSNEDGSDFPGSAPQSPKADRKDDSSFASYSSYQNAPQGSQKEEKTDSEYPAEEEEPSDFFSQTVAAAKKIVIETKHLKELGTTSANEEDLLEGAKSTALSTFALLDLVQNHFSDSHENLTVQQNLLIEATKRVRTAVLTFIDAVKAVATNPFDFFSKQQLTLTSKEVVDSIKQLLATAENVDSVAEASDDSGFDVVDDVRRTTQAVKELSQAIEEDKPEKFAQASKAFVLAMNQLVNIGSEHNLPVESQLKDATLSLVHSAKIALTNPDDPVIMEQWKRSQKNVSKCLHTFLFYASKISNKMKRSSWGLLMKTDNLSSEDKDLHKAGETILQWFKQSFPNFGAEWDEMPPETKSEAFKKLLQTVRPIMEGAKERLQPKDDSDMKELKSLMVMKTTNDWHKGKRGTLTRKEARYITGSEAAGINLHLVAEETMKPIENIISLAAQVLENQVETHIREKHNEMKALMDTIMESLKKCLQTGKNLVNKTQGKNDKANQLISRIVDGGVAKLDQLIKLDKAGKSVGTEFSWEGNLLKLKAIERQLPGKIEQSCETLRTFAAQLLVTSNAFETASDTFSLLGQLGAEIQGIATALTDVLTHCDTFYLVLKEQELAKSGQVTIKGSLEPASEKNVWDEPKGKYEGERDFVGGTLNQIIRHLTTVVDNNFMTTFILTYQSFTTPSMVVEKLNERYRGPETNPSSIPLQELLRIKLRVCVVLNYWIGKQFHDFDDEVIDKLNKFISSIKNDQQKEMQEMGNRLFGEFTKQLDKRAKGKKNRVIIATPIDAGLNLPPSALFMQFNDLEVAKQLTLLEFKIFSKIKANELLKQAWNKPELQYRSPHVIRLISRSNKLSFFVASIILWNPKSLDRVKAIEKFIRIADHLHSMNNFNTLVSLIAGLNVSAVSRLKFTWDQVDLASRSKLSEFQDLFSPSNSFKIYRAAKKVASSKGPVLPYIGVPLSDLTFAEDGNTDFLPGSAQLMNFSKREVLSKIIVEFQLNQSQVYSFPVVEPLYSFFKNPPINDEKECYDLSLQLEPRGAQKSEIK